MSPMYEENRRFLGLTKGQFYVVVLVLVVASLALNTFTTLRTQNLQSQTHQTAVNAHKLAEEGAQAHIAMCAYKRQEQDAIDQTRAFLKMTPAEAAAKYGPKYAATLENVPRSTFYQVIAKEQKTVRSLRALRCP